MTDYLVYATSSGIYSLNVNSDVGIVPFSPRTNLSLVQSVTYDYVSRSVYFTAGLEQKLKRWTIGGQEVSDIDVVAPYNVSGQYFIIHIL